MSLPPPPDDRPRSGDAVPPPTYQTGAPGSSGPYGSGGQGWGEGGYAGPQRRVMSPADERLWGMTAHLSALIMVVGIPSLVGPLVVWLVKRDQSAFVEDQSKEALNFNLSVFLYGIVGGIVASILAVLTLGVGLLVIVPLALLLAVAWLVFVIIGAVRANNGETYRYPLTIRFIT